MKKIFVLSVLVGAFCFLPMTVDAKPLGFHLDATLGSSYTFRTGSSPEHPLGNFGSSLEVMPSVRFLMFTADLGLQYDFVQGNFTLRPGMRMFLGWFYLRTAIPMAFSFQGGTSGELFDLGILVGAGARISMGRWAFVAEANVSPYFLHINRRGLSMPAEIRLGVAYNF